jgi:hypothetical protein
LNMQLSVRSRPASIVSAWIQAGILAGAGLGGIYGALVGISVGIQVFPLAFIVGCLVGSIAGLLAGALNGVMLAALARPLRLDMISGPAAIRAAIVTAMTTEIFLLPVQFAFDPIKMPAWLFLVLAPSIASVAAGALLGLRLPPAGRVADPEACVSIRSVSSTSVPSSLA